MTKTPAKALAQFEDLNRSPDAPANGARQKIAEALCCPTTGCVRTDDCLAGERREQREQLEAVLALTPAPADEVREAWQALLDAARAMPRATPGPGGASTEHTFKIEAAKVWDLDRALLTLAALSQDTAARTEEREALQGVVDWWDSLPPNLRQDIEGSGAEPGVIAIARRTAKGE